MREDKCLDNKVEFPFSPYRIRRVGLISTVFWVYWVRTERFCMHFLFWRYKAISTNNKDLPINDEIKAPEVRVIGPNNEQVGIMKIEDARNFAYNNGVDLV